MKKFFRFLREWTFPRKSDLMSAYYSYSSLKKEVFIAILAATAFFGFFAIIKISDSFATQVPIVGGTITEGVIGVPRFINPVLAVSDTDKDLTTLIYSGLMKRLPDGSIVPDLAEKYEISSDKQTYTFTLRDTAVFHDGTKVTAADVLYTIHTIQDPSFQSPRRTNWSGITVRSDDERTIVITLPKPYSSFLDTATVGILPSTLWKETTPETFNFLALNTEPIGTGPFMYAGMEKKRNGIPTSYTLNRFKQYALGAPYIRQITLELYGNQAELTRALENGDIDQAGTIEPSEAVKLEAEGRTVKTAVLPRVFAIFFNPNHRALFADRSLVKVLNEAVAKDKIIQEVFHSYASVVDGPVPFQPILSSRVIPEKRTPEQIQAEFARLGWTKSADGFLIKNTTKETLAFSLATADTPELVAVAKEIQNNLGQYGIVVNLKIFDLGALNQTIIAPRAYDALLFGHVIENEADLYAFWHSSQRSYPGLNIAGYASSKADGLLQSILSATDESILLRDLALFDETVRTDRPAIPLYLPHFLYVTDSKVKGVDLDRLANPSNRFLGVHKWYIETEPVWNIFTKKNN